MKSGKTCITRIIHATGYSFSGLRAAWTHEPAIRQEVILLLVGVPITFFLDVTKIEQMLMIECLLLIIIVELLNSAIEAVVDRVGSEYHELSGRAKDIGSAAVFVTLCLAVFIWTCSILF